VVLPVSLTRGHSYRIELVLFLAATGDATGSASADFASTAGWDDLTIVAGSDVLGAIANYRNDGWRVLERRSGSIRIEYS